MVKVLRPCERCSSRYMIRRKEYWYCPVCKWVEKRKVRKSDKI